MAELPSKSETKAGGSAAEPGIDIDQVLDVAANLFAEFGFDGVSMREISRESGCATPSIYYHFTSKADLYHEVFAHKIDQTIDIINGRIGGLSDPQARFRELVEAFFDMFTSDRTLLLLMQRDVIDAAVTRRRFLSKRQYEHFTLLIQRLGSELAGTAIDNDSAFTLAGLIFGYCELYNVVHEIDDPRSDDARRQEKARLVAAALKLLAP